MSNQNPDWKKDISFQSGPSMNEQTSHHFNNVELCRCEGLSQRKALIYLYC